MSGLTAVSLFAGVGGFDLALERSGVDVVAAVEIDDAARGVLADRFPGTTLFNDVRKVTGDELRAAGFVPERGILTGGFPCQDLSLAGRRGGLGEGTRSGLFWEIDRLVAELRPAWVVLENVPGILSAVCPDPDSPSIGLDDLPNFTDDDGLIPDDKFILAEELSGTVQGRGACEGGCLPAHGGAMGLVLGSLADRGYGFAYRVLDAQYTGVPQRRRRVFIVGRSGGDARGPVEVLLEPESGTRHPATRRDARKVVAALTADGVGTCGADDNQAQAGHLIAHTLTGEGHDASEDGTGRGTPLVPMASYPVNWAGRGMELGQPEVANAIRSAGDGHVGDQMGYVLRALAVRRLTPLECERLQGFPDRWTFTSGGRPQADAARYRQCGNAVAVPVIEWIAGRVVAAHFRRAAA